MPIKKTILIALLLSLICFSLFPARLHADMSSYCAVPPYVIQDVPPNIMLLVDNSGSMYNLAYACTSSHTSAGGNSTNVIPLKSVQGFKVGQSIGLTPSGSSTTTQLWITAVNTTNKTVTVGSNITFSQNATVQDFGCVGNNYYDVSSGSCPASISVACDNPGASPSTTVSTAHSNSTTVTVVSVSGFTVGESIIIGTSSRTITAISGKNLTVNSTITTSVGQVVKDANYDACHNYSSGANILFSSTVSDFSVGEVIVVLHGGIPYTVTVTARDTTANTLQVAPSLSLSKGDSIYDYNCYNFQTPYPEQSFDPNKTYYGYFNGDYWYTYSTNRFVPSRLKSAGAKTATEWDGNFLNWLTMRRSDVIKRVLTGGYTVGGEASGFDKLRAVIGDNSGRGIYKAVATAEQYMGCTGCTGNINFVFSTGTAPPSSFTAYSGSATSWTSRGSFSVDVVVPTPVEGAIQNVVGSKARIGLTFYNASGSGGSVKVPVSATSMSTVVKYVNLIHANQPSPNNVDVTNTPLAETLWTITGYFAQQATMESGPGPRYSSTDFTIDSTNDPWNYGSSATPRWPSCAKSYVLLITDGEPCQDGNLPTTLKDYAAGKSIFNCQNTTCPALTGTAPEDYSFPASTISGGCASGSGAGLEDVALYMHTKDLRSSTLGVSNINGTQNLTLFTVFAFGRSSMLLRYAAINGGFNDLNGTGKPDSQSKWGTSGKKDEDGYSIPDNYWEADDGPLLEQGIRGFLSTMLKRASSGTAASVLSSGEGSGANLVQAVFYPRHRFGNDVIGWTGENQNFWFYVDPFFSNSSIREDTVVESPDRALNLINDYVVQLYYDTTQQQTMARRYQDTSGDGSTLVAKTTVPIENVSNIWRAGDLLWNRKVETQPRTIYTPCLSGGTCLSSQKLMYFSESNSTALASYLQLPLSVAGNDKKTSDVIRFTHGYRTTSDGFSFDYAPDPSNPPPSDQTVDRNSDTIPDYRLRTVTIGGQANIWKLGDIINSTPKISSWAPLNAYFTRYNDTSYDKFTKSAAYKDRGMVFAGGNDGMLHAFKLGKLVVNWKGQGLYQKAKLVNTDPSTPIGHEPWAFIPKNVLPYLLYVADPNYCHLYSVDLTPVIFDASIGAPGSGDISAGDKPDDGSTWRTVLIGGMRLGGACRKGTCNSKACSVTTGTSCTTDTNCPAGEKCLSNCVNTPLTDPSAPGQGLGYSSYFALDVTDQNNPYLLWEFSDDTLGFATTGPAIVRVGAKTKNGKWFAVVGSGPTGPIDTTNLQFLGRSDQPLKFFVLDLKTGTLAATISPGVSNAFAGSLFDASVDTDFDYQDDAIYAGYVKKSGSAWTDGGIGVILTKNDANPANWRWRTIMDGIGPVTSSVANLQDTRNSIMWLYFGTGRFYYAQGTTIDDQDSLRYLIGVKDPCFSTTSDKTGLNNSCTTTASLSSLTDVTSVSNAPTETTANASGFKGWKIQLDASGSYTYAPDPATNFRAERVVTDTLTTVAGNVVFTTYKPYSDECGVGGKTFVWAARYNTAGAPGSLLKGIVLMQTSSSAISQINFKDALPLAGGRKSASVDQPPSGDKPAMIELPPPVKKVIHMRER